MKENTFKDQLEYCNTMNDMEYLPVNPQVKNGACRNYLNPYFFGRLIASKLH